IKLLAKLSGGLCTDILDTTIYRYPVCRVYDTVWPSICDDSSYLHHDSLLIQPGIYRIDSDLFTYVAVLEVRPTGVMDTTMSVCDSLWWDYGMNYTSQYLEHHIRTTQNCDSTRILRLTVLYSSDTVFPDTVVQNQLPRRVGNAVFGDVVGDTLLHVANHVGCDSSIYYSLHVWNNVFTAYDTTVCNHVLPMQWGAGYFTHACTQSITLRGAGQHGVDSTVTLTMYVNPDHYLFFNDSTSDTTLPIFFNGRRYTTAVHNDTFYYINQYGCDSVLHFTLSIDYHVVSCDKALMFPNVVTPNGDGINDRFVILGLIENDCYEHSDLTIYNRWGGIVFSQKDTYLPSQFWDPAAQQAPAGTYIYHFSAHGPHGTVTRNGVIEVVY
ncbi:MAG: gliding motility-associated C-terminal domain-containing protein, partial [Bacteroidales bacterium]|nr:gliding motility-associated C-terminal domain-containing protein [Candidatus Colimorpha onthohippi]